MSCEHQNTEIIDTPHLTHHAKEECIDCGQWLRWVKSPEKEGKRTFTSKYKIKDILTFHKKDKEFCFFCLRTRKQLGEKETLTIDHIEELNDNGTDELENLQILCTSCHKMKNWMRLYVNWHLTKFYKKEDDDGANQ